jgi:hypothetical protein
MSSRYFFSLAKSVPGTRFPSTATQLPPVCAALVMRDCNTPGDCAISLMRDSALILYKSLI